jgi:predicted transcriptional regulator
MASLREAAEQITGQLEDLVGQLREELSDGDVDFEKLGGLADQLSERADGLAETFTSVNETLMERVNQMQDGGGAEKKEKSGSRRGRGKSSDD